MSVLLPTVSPGGADPLHQVDASMSRQLVPNIPDVTGKRTSIFPNVPGSFRRKTFLVAGAKKPVPIADDSTAGTQANVDVAAQCDFNSSAAAERTGAEISPAVIDTMDASYSGLAATGDAAKALLTVLKETTDMFLPLKAVAAGALWILDATQKFKSNKKDWHNFGLMVCTYTSDVTARVHEHPLPSSKLLSDVETFEIALQGIKKEVQKKQSRPFAVRVAQTFEDANFIEGLRKQVYEAFNRFMTMSAISIRLAIETSDIIVTTARKSDRDFWTVPPATRLFTGRLDALEKMHECFKLPTPASAVRVQRVFVLSGLGGAGKTQIALRFVQEIPERFSKALFVDASSQTVIEAALVSIGRAVPIPDATWESVIQWFCSISEEWLIIFDNADDINLPLQNYIPQCAHGNVIITSRNPACKVHANTGYHYNVEDMQSADAVELLLKASGVEASDVNKDLAGQLAIQLGHLPLAIRQAAAYIQQSVGMEFEGYLKLFASSRRELLDRDPLAQKADTYKFTVYATWELSFERLIPRAQQFLQICAFLHYDGILEDMFEHALLRARPRMTPEEYGKNTEKSEDGEAVEEPEHSNEGTEDSVYFDADEYCETEERGENRQSEEHMSEELKFQLSTSLAAEYLESWGSGDDGKWDSFTFQKMIRDIASYSLLRPGSNRSYSFHPLVHAWARDRLSPEENLLARQTAARIMAWAVNDDKTTAEGYQYRRRLVVHIDEVTGMNGLKFDDGFVDGASYIYRELGRYAEAETLLARLVTSRKQLLGEKHVRTSDAMSSLATTFWHQGRWAEAEELERQVLDVRKEVLGERHPETLTTMGNLASTFMNQGRWGEAEELQSQVLEARKEVLGERHPDTLSTMGNLATTFCNQGRWAEAEELQRQVLNVGKEVWGERHPNTLTTMGSLAVTLWHHGRLREAEELEVRVVDLRKQILGEEHPNTILAMFNLAVTLRAQGRFEEAESLQVEVLTLRLQILGERHPDTIKAMKSLAVTYRKKDRIREAEDLEAQVTNLEATEPT